MLLTLAVAGPLLYVGNPAVALLVGAALSLALNRAPVALPASVSRVALQTAIVLLGFGLNVGTLWTLSAGYAWIVACYVLGTFAVGIGLGRWLSSDATVAKLIAAGTAICGGTAIATIAPVLNARPSQTSVALAVVFVLNAVALFTFPLIGEYLDMSQVQFGLWSALAIHDTSSVVATAAIYGDHAAEVATTLKLGRTLWLIPLVFGISVVTNAGQAKLRVPGFILLFIAASVLGTLIAIPAPLLAGTAALSKSLLVVALFLVGAELSRTTLRQLHGRTLAHALLLWALVVPITGVLVLNLA